MRHRTHARARTRVQRRRRRVVGSLVGSPSQTRDMLAFCVNHDIATMVSHVAPMSDVNNQLTAMRQGKAMFRIVLSNEQEK